MTRKAKIHGNRDIRLTISNLTGSLMGRLVETWVLVSALPLAGIRTSLISLDPQCADRNFLGPSRFQTNLDGGREEGRKEREGEIVGEWLRKNVPIFVRAFPSDIITMDSKVSQIPKWCYDFLHWKNAL